MAQLIKFAFRKSHAQLAKEKAKKNGVNNLKLKDILGDYAKNFTKDIDTIWFQCDDDECGVLDKEEAKKFLAEAKKCISPERAANYDEANFDKIFNKFDEHMHGYIEK